MGNSLLPQFPPIGQKSVYHCQFPFPDDDKKNRLRLSWAAEYDALVVNSSFTEHSVHSDQDQNVWRDKTWVIEPPVDTAIFSLENTEIRESGSKNFRIVSVGRFFEGQHCKNQLEMVQAFDELKHDFDDIELLLIGGVAADLDSMSYFKKVVGRAAAKNIFIRPDASRKSVIQEVRSSNLYWHATGLGVRKDEPWRMEHFGIAPIEACQLGVFPLVHDSGGAGVNLRLLSDSCVYQDIDDLVVKTRSILVAGVVPLTQHKIMEFGKSYSTGSFKEKWNALFNVLS
jgi:glycosyltransferase involved in cell wall biosynthesis